MPKSAFVARGANIILSEIATARLGFATPAAAIGKQIQRRWSSPEPGLVTATIVGVVSDVRYRIVRDPIQPILYYYLTADFNRCWCASPAIRGGGATVESVVEAVGAGRAVSARRFVEDIVNDLYKSDEKSAQLFGMFAILAVVIGCLGLFGLAAFTAERRTKEIGIRKVLGARTRDIMRLLVWQFSRPVLIANLIAWPIAWWVMRGWLNDFDMRMTLVPCRSSRRASRAGHRGGDDRRPRRPRGARSPIKALRYE